MGSRRSTAFLRGGHLALCCFLTFSAALPAHAGSVSWIGATGNWDDPENWSSVAQPVAGDDVFVAQDGDEDIVVHYTSSADAGGQLSSITVDSLGTGNASLSVEQGVLQAAAEIVGSSGTGSVVQSGGTNTIRLDSHEDHGELMLGANAGSSGIYELNGGTLSTYRTAVGGSGSGTFIQTGGNHSTMALDVGSEEGGEGTYILVDGAIGRDDMSSSIGVDAPGTFIQSGGTFIVDSSLRVGSQGTYDLGDGLVEALENAYIDGTFNQSGGTFYVVPGLSISGSYNLTGGVLSVPEGLSVEGTLNQQGGVVGHQLWGTGTFEVAGAGTYNLSEGSLEMRSDRDFINRGVFNYSGGEVHLGADGSGTFTNYGTANLSGQGTRTLDGNVVNNGTFKTTNTSVIFTGTFTNNGAYISDPATQYFNDLLVNESGYLVGTHLDNFVISGDFINHSTMNDQWDTADAYLGFLDGEDAVHAMYITGYDYGAGMLGYDDNFSWGTLDIAGDDLHLFDGNGTEGGALYVSAILGLQITDYLVFNITGMDGLNIYYLSTLPENSYLLGRDYDLQGGGHLIAINDVPEPSVLLLFGTGLLGLVGLNRRRKA